MPPATSSSCSSLMDSGLLVSSLILSVGLWFSFVKSELAGLFSGAALGNVDRAQHVGAANALNRGRIVDAAGNVFELFVADLFWFVGFFAHIRSVCSVFGFRWDRGSPILPVPDLGDVDRA